MTLLRILAAIAVVVVTLVGICLTVAFLRSTTFPDRYIKRPVTSSDIVGHWQITSASLKKASDYLRNWPEPKIQENLQEFECRADGTVTGTTFEPAGTSLTGGRPNSFKGTWRIGSDRGFKGHNMVPEPCVKLETQSQPWECRSSRLFINEEGGELVLWAGIGDPDDLQWIEWKKTVGAPTATAPAESGG